MQALTTAPLPLSCSQVRGLEEQLETVKGIMEHFGPPTPGGRAPGGRAPRPVAPDYQQQKPPTPPDAATPQQMPQPQAQQLQYRLEEPLPPPPQSPPSLPPQQQHARRPVQLVFGDRLRRSVGDQQLVFGDLSAELPEDVAAEEEVEEEDEQQDEQQDEDEEESRDDGGSAAHSTYTRTSPSVP